MQLKYYQTILQPTTGIMKVTAVCWSPNGKKLAVCTTDRVVILFDDTGARRDKFSTKPIDKVAPNFIELLFLIAISRGQKTILSDKWHFRHSPIDWQSLKVIIWYLCIK